MKSKSQKLISIVFLMVVLCEVLTNVYAHNNGSSHESTLLLECELSDDSIKQPAGQSVNSTGVQTNPGMSRVILDNHNSNQPALRQSDFQKKNTIYVIKFDFTLSETIKMPANCILEFEGGSLMGGTIIGDNTSIIAGDYAIFNDCVIKRFNLPYVDPRWAGAIPDFDERTKKGTDNSRYFQRAYDNIAENHPGLDILINGKYLISKTVLMRMQCHLKGVHHNTRGLVKRNLHLETGGSSSLIAVGDCAAFRVIGNESEDKTWADFSIEGIKFVGLNKSKSIAIQYEASGAPTRPATIEKCEASNLQCFLFTKAKQSSIIGSLTIKENNIYNCTKAIYAMSEPEQKMGLAALKIENNVIEHNGDKCIYLNRCFGPIIIDNNVLEGETNPIYITSTCDVYTNYVISNNYFESPEDNDKKIHIDGVVSKEGGDFDHVLFLTSVEIFGNTSIYGLAIELNGVVIKRLDRIDTPSKGKTNYSTFTRCLFEDIEISDLYCCQFQDWNFSTSYPTSSFSHGNSLIGKTGIDLLSFDDCCGNAHANKNYKVSVSMSGDNGNSDNLMIARLRPQFTGKYKKIILKSLLNNKNYSLGVAFPREIPYYAFRLYKKDRNIRSSNYNLSLSAYNGGTEIEMSNITVYKNVDGALFKYSYISIPYTAN